MTETIKLRIEELEREISELKGVWPAHSVPPAMLMQLDEQEEELAKEIARLTAADQPNPMWTCPECGHQFVNANTFHSCGKFSIDDHFAGKDLVIRLIFDRLVAAVKQFGPATVYAQKSRIVFQARTRFVAVTPRNRWLSGHIWLKRRAEHPRIYRLEMFTYRDYGHMFRLHQPEDVDEPFVKLLHEAYALGSS